MNAGPRVARVACDCAYTPPSESRCFGPVVATADGSTTRRCARLANTGCLCIGAPRALPSYRRRHLPPTAQRGCLCPEAAVRAVPARLLLLCLLLRSSRRTVGGDRQVGAARVLHRRGGRAAVAVSVGVAGGVPMQKSPGRSATPRECRMFAKRAVSSLPAGGPVLTHSARPGS